MFLLIVLNAEMSARPDSTAGNASAPKCIDVTSIGQRSSPWPCRSVKFGIKIYPECNYLFPCAPTSLGCQFSELTYQYVPGLSIYLLLKSPAWQLKSRDTRIRDEISLIATKQLTKRPSCGESQRVDAGSKVVALTVEYWKQCILQGGNRRNMRPAAQQERFSLNLVPRAFWPPVN